MRGGRRALALVAAVCALVAAPKVAAAAWDVPVDGGRVDVGAGIRTAAGLAPYATARFAWQMSRALSLGIDLGYRLGVPRSGEPTMSVFDLRASLAWHAPSLGPIRPYLVGGLGQHLVGIQRPDGAYVEVAPSGVHLGGGVWTPIAERLGLFLEGRFGYALIDGSVLGREGPVNVAGVQVVAGLVLTFPAERRISQ